MSVEIKLNSYYSCLSNGKDAIARKTVKMMDEVSGWIDGILYDQGAESRVMPLTEFFSWFEEKKEDRNPNLDKIKTDMIAFSSILGKGKVISVNKKDDADWPILCVFKVTKGGLVGMSSDWQKTKTVSERYNSLGESKSTGKPDAVFKDWKHA